MNQYSQNTNQNPNPYGNQYGQQSNMYNQQQQYSQQQNMYNQQQQYSQQQNMYNQQSQYNQQTNMYNQPQYNQNLYQQPQQKAPFKLKPIDIVFIVFIGLAAMLMGFKLLMGDLSFGDVTPFMSATLIYVVMRFIIHNNKNKRV